MSEQKEDKDLTAFQDYLLNGEIDRAKRLLNTKCQELTNVIRGRPAIPDYKVLPRDDLATALIQDDVTATVKDVYWRYSKIVVSFLEARNCLFSPKI